METAGLDLARPDVAEISADEAEATFDSAARFLLGISGAEFRRRWHGGFYKSPDSIPGVIEVASIMPAGDLPG